MHCAHGINFNSIPWEYVQFLMQKKTLPKLLDGYAYFGKLHLYDNMFQTPGTKELGYQIT